MSFAYFWLFIAINLFAILLACRRRDGVFLYHFLAALVLIGWAGPQLVGLLKDPGLPPGSLDRLLIYACLCSVAILLGGTLPMGRTSPVFRRLGAHSDVLLAIAVGGIGLLAFAMVRIYVSRHGDDLGAQWSGPVTIMQFFSKLTEIGLALGLLCWMRKKSTAAAAITLAASLVYVYLIVWLGRRGPMLEFALAIMILFWHVHRVTVPAPIMVVLAALCSVFFYSIGAYRQLVIEQGLSLDTILQVDYLAGIRTIVEGHTVELKNALYFMELVQRQFAVDFGASIWNRFIDLYVPGQIVGDDFKSALKFDLMVDVYTEFRYRAPPGSTFTGFSDSFGAFGYFGCVLFFAVARIMTYLWHRVRTGDDVAVVFYTLLISPSLHGITHQVSWFFSFIPLYAIFFLIPIMLLTGNRRYVRCRVPAAAAVHPA